MGDQTSQRQDLASKGAQASRQLLAALNTLQACAARRPFLGNFADADFAGNPTLAYLDPGTIGVLFDVVVPYLTLALADAGDGGRAVQILQQCASQL